MLGDRNTPSHGTVLSDWTGNACEGLGGERIGQILETLESQAVELRLGKKWEPWKVVEQ